MQHAFLFSPLHIFSICKALIEIKEYMFLPQNKDCCFIKEEEISALSVHREAS